MNLHRLENHVRILGYVLALLLASASIGDPEDVSAGRQSHANRSIAACGTEGLPAVAVVLHYGTDEPISIAS